MLDPNDSFNYAIQQNSESHLSRRLIAVYTVLLILRNMRDRLGIEAMLSFLESYTRTIERVNPDIKDAVNEELLERALKGLYEVVCNEKK